MHGIVWLIVVLSMKTNPRLHLIRYPFTKDILTPREKSRVVAYAIIGLEMFFARVF